MGALRLLFLFSLLSLTLQAANNSASSNASPSPPTLPSFNGLVFGHATMSNGTALSSQPLFILVRSEAATTTYRLLTDKAGNFLLSLEEQNYEVDALFDKAGTPGMDGAATTSINLSSEQNLTLIFWPAGSAAGTVLNNGSAVGSAALSVNCPSAAFDYDRINGGPAYRSGEAGNFLFRALPEGICLLSASTGSLAGSSEVNVSQGSVQSVKLQLLPKAPPSPPAQTDNTLWLLVGAAVLIGAALLAAGAWKKKKSSAYSSSSNHKTKQKPKAAKAAASSSSKEIPAAPPSSQESASSQPTYSAASKLASVLPTLSEREAEIVKYLSTNNGRAKRSTMQQSLLIPKTSLLRTLRSLERKKILTLAPFGRNVVAQLSEWLKEN